MALIATLEDFSFLELIHNSVTYQKTGVFTYRGSEDESTAEVYVEDGEIVHATHGDQEGEPVLVDLFFRNEGTITFTTGEKAHRKTITHDSLELIVAYADRVDEIRRIQQELPSLDIVLVRSPQPERGKSQIDITLDQWQVLSLANGHRTIRDIISDSGKSDVIIKEMLVYLIGAGLLVDPVEMERLLQQYLDKLNQFYQNCNVPEVHGLIWPELVDSILNNPDSENMVLKFLEFKDNELKVKENTLMVCNKAEIHEFYGQVKEKFTQTGIQEYGHALMRYKITALNL